MKRTKPLPSVHYDESLLADFIDQIKEFSDVTETEIKIRWGDGDSATYDNETDLFRDTKIPDRISNFRVTLHADEGRISLNADSRGGRETHSVTVDGEKEWVHSSINVIREFAEQRSGTLGRIFQKKWTRWVQFALFGILVSYIGGYVINLIIPFYYSNPISTVRMSVTILLVLSIISIEFVNMIYPYVTLRRRGTEPLIRRVSVVITSILTIISTIAALVGLLNG
jgi:hypothetical protein